MNYQYDHQMGQKIRQLRIDRGWTQEQLSAQLQLHDCDISRGTLGNIESGLRHVYACEIKVFKEIFMVSYDDLFV